MFSFRKAFTGAFLGAGLLASAGPVLGQHGEVPKSPSLGVVYRYADTLIKSGRDVYGPEKTNLFLGALDRQSLKALSARPAAPAGLREDQRVGGASGPLAGANPQQDENLLKMMYTLKGLSQNAGYVQAADDEIKWFFTHARWADNGLLPWGEGMYWDVMEDRSVPPKPPADYTSVRPWVLWDRACELAPEESVRYASALLDQQLAKQPQAGPREAGFCIRACAAAYACKKDERFLKGLASLLEKCEKGRHPRSGLMAEKSGAASLGAMLSLAIDCEAAAGLVPEPLASRLRESAARTDEVFSSLPHDLAGAGRFLTQVDRESGASLSSPADPLWDPAQHAQTTAAIGMMCVARYEHVGRPAYRKLISQAADAYLKSQPGPDVDAWPLTFGQAISLELGAWRATAKPIYFQRAGELGQLAVDLFWQDSPLPRASLKSQHYESATGADTLANALLELHLSTLHITAVQLPTNTIDR